MPDLPFEVPQSPAAVPQSGDLEELEHDDDISPVLFMQMHDDWINDVIQVVWACRHTIQCEHFLELSGIHHLVLQGIVHNGPHQCR